MEPNITGISKKIWNIVRVAIFMIRKGLNKKKIFMDLNLMMKRGKIAGKTLKNLMFHHHNNHDNHHDNDGAREYEFSCSDTPLYTQYFLKNRKNHQKNTHYYNYMPSPLPLEESENINIEEVNAMLEMMLRNEQATAGGEICAASPVFPGLGFRRSPAVRQLRITDSPFPVHNGEDDNKVDEAAEDFIKKFYSQLKQQKF